MDAPYEDLKKYCSLFLYTIDSYQQMNSEILTEENNTQFFVDSYYKFKDLYQQLHPCNIPNELREQIKLLSEQIDNKAYQLFNHRYDFEKNTNRFQN